MKLIFALCLLAGNALAEDSVKPKFTSSSVVTCYCDGSRGDTPKCPEMDCAKQLMIPKSGQSMYLRPTPGDNVFTIEWLPHALIREVRKGNFETYDMGLRSDGIVMWRKH